MVDIGIVEIIGLGAPLGIIGTMFIVLYFSRKQAQDSDLDIETKILNDLDEKVRKMAEIIVEKPSLQKVIYKLEKPSEELAFATYILFILLMLMRCVKEMCSRIMNGQDGYNG
jgi:H+/gluconate symporter-like permease